MIQSQTPFRVSLFGGGTDFPAWYNKNGGKVLSSSIQQFSYITVRYLPKIFGVKNRIVYSKIELEDKISDIRHPSVRAVLQYMRINEGLEISYNADLPSFTGLGGSSSFTVGLLNALYSLKNIKISKKKLSEKAIFIEQKILKEPVGSQDQIAASHGGFNLINFNKNNLSVKNIKLSLKKKKILENNLHIFFTGKARFSSKIEKDKIKNIKQNFSTLKFMMESVEEGYKIINSDSVHYNDLGYLLNETWSFKKSLSKKVSNNFIDNIYEIALKNGALGGKILGAGGGGFFLFYCSKSKINLLKKKLNKLFYLPFKICDHGSQIVVKNIK